jgi:hypothetical protein
MQIILGLLAILGGAAFWWWRIKMIGDAAGEIGDVAGRAMGQYRRNKFRKKVEDSPLEAVRDPAAAAVVMLYAMAQEAGPVTAEVEAAIRQEAETTMKLAKPDEVLVFGKWAASHALDANNVSLRYGKLWAQALTREEREELYRMAERIGRAAKLPAAVLSQKLQRLAERSGLET